MSTARTMSRGLASIAAALAVTLLLAGCERPPVDVVQRGFRGTGMELVYNPRTLIPQTYQNVAPEPQPAAPAEGPKAKDVYKNVQVLGDLSVAEFNRTMVAISSWLAPAQQCTYCHAPGEGFEADTKYQKVVARRMLQMTQAINTQWTSHVGDTGVTCYTCHRGQANPAQTWFRAPQALQASRMMGDDAGQNKAVGTGVNGSLPYNALAEYLLEGQNIRVNGTTALPTGNRQSIKQAEFTYALMMHMSTGLGVNCTYCHNTQNFGKWEGSPPQRTTAWHGIRMARQINSTYIEPLNPVFPASEKGALGDVAKVACGTCHQGAYKPLYGAQMARDYPGLTRPQAAAPAPAQRARQAAR